MIQNVSKTKPAIATGILVLIGVVCFVSAIGCHRFRRPCEPPRFMPQPSVFFGSQPDLSSVRRVVMLPVENRTHIHGIEKQFQNQVAAKIRTAGLFEIVQVDPWDVPACNSAFVNEGQFPLELLVDVYRRYQADAVLFTSINEYRAYDPISIGLTMHLVNTAEGSVVSSIDGHWTIGDPDTAHAFRKYLTKISARSADPKVLVHSPGAFSEFVAGHIANIWRRYPDGAVQAALPPQQQTSPQTPSQTR